MRNSSTVVGVGWRPRGLEISMSHAEDCKGLPDVYLLKFRQIHISTTVENVQLYSQFIYLVFNFFFFSKKRFRVTPWSSGVYMVENT